MRNIIDISIFITIVLVVGFIINIQEERITKIENINEALIVENNQLKFQFQKQCNTDVETVIELERVMKEMSGE